jgi:hypothetical protein
VIDLLADGPAATADGSKPLGRHLSRTWMAAQERPHHVHPARLYSSRTLSATSAHASVCWPRCVGSGSTNCWHEEKERMHPRRGDRRTNEGWGRSACLQRTRELGLDHVPAARLSGLGWSSFLRAGLNEEGAGADQSHFRNGIIACMPQGARAGAVCAQVARAAPVIALVPSTKSSSSDTRGRDVSSSSPRGHARKIVVSRLPHALAGAVRLQRAQPKSKSRSFGGHFLPLNS